MAHEHWFSRYELEAEALAHVGAAIARSAKHEHLKKARKSLLGHCMTKLATGSSEQWQNIYALHVMAVYRLAQSRTKGILCSEEQLAAATNALGTRSSHNA